MLLSIGAVVVALLFAAGLWVLGLKAYKQNRRLIQALREDSRNTNTMLWKALVVWSPMLAVIVVLLFVANIMSWGTTELAYRFTTLDEFCEVKALDSPLYVACTGMGSELHANQIKPVNPREDIERQLFRRYSVARKELLLTPLNELRKQAKNHVEFRKSFLPMGVLGLAPGSEDDAMLSRLVTQRRWVLQSPTPAPTDIVGILSYRQSVATRNRILRDLDAKIDARSKALHAAEYGQLTPEQVLQHDRRNRIFLLLRKVNLIIDPAVQVTLLSPAEDGATSLDFVRKALVRALAHSELAARQILSRESDTPTKAAAVYDALNMVPECTVASENAAVRFNANDFSSDQSNNGLADPATFTINNAGSFPCFARQESGHPLKLVSVGFRKSVLLSIDRLRDEAAQEAFKKLNTLEHQAMIGATDAKISAREATHVVPTVIHLGRQDCGFMHPVNCAMNGSAGAAEAAYSRSRNALVKRYTERADAQVNASTMTIQQSIDQARITTDAEVAQMHDAGVMTAESIFKLNDVLRGFGWIVLFLIAMRSFLYVFALELFDRNGELRISFDVENPIQGHVVSGSEVTIHGDFPFPIINRGSLTNTLADIEFAPWKWSAPISRILHGRYFLFNRSVFSPPNGANLLMGAGEVKGMEASARSGYSIVEWRMQPGEEVIFNYKDFYGASVNVQLKTDFSLRLSTLLLGRVFFHYAHCIGGEGRLLLEARVHNTTQAGLSSIKPTRLVAWNRHVQFSADSHRHVWKTFINPYTIVRESTPGLAKGLVIIAPESESPYFFGIGFRSLKRIFSRIF
ncbi:MAG: hypothetical protein ABIP02_06425 [Arenimonas sp.]